MTEDHLYSVNHYLNLRNGVTGYFNDLCEICPKETREALADKLVAMGGVIVRDSVDGKIADINAEQVNALKVFSETASDAIDAARGKNDSTQNFIILASHVTLLAKSVSQLTSTP